MKKFLLFLLVLIAIVFAGSMLLKATKEKVKQDFAGSNPYPSTIPSPAISYTATSKESASLFVPYWSVNNALRNQTDYDSYIYFGVTPNTDGIDMKDPGAKALPSFLTHVPKDKKKYITLRMINADNNFTILKNPKKQDTLIRETIALAKENHFDGIVLDLEVTAIPFESLVKQINVFTKSFYQEVKKNNLTFALTIYGDVFYRVRPFDVKTLAQNTDMVMIMAYDFSKAKSNPGPNFPLNDAETYGYDYTKMTKDFLRVVPSSKIAVVFGMFGYDWLVDEKGKATEQARALTLSQIKNKFLTKCAYKNCSVARDTNTSEEKVVYTDDAGTNHIVWFEDLQSVAAKKKFLKSRGISTFSYWAYSYFD